MNRKLDRAMGMRYYNRWDFLIATRDFFVFINSVLFSRTNEDWYLRLDAVNSKGRDLAFVGDVCYKFSCNLVEVWLSFQLTVITRLGTTKLPKPSTSHDPYRLVTRLFVSAKLDIDWIVIE